MRHNRVLGLAIASALAIGANSSFGGVLTVTHIEKDTNGNCVAGLKTEPAVLAREIFFSGNPVVFSTAACGAADDLDNNTSADGPFNGPATDPPAYDDLYFYATYRFDTLTYDTEPFLAQFTLDNGAQFGKAISLAPGTSLDFVAHPSGSHAGVTINSGGKVGDSQVTFYIMPNKENTFRVNDDTLVLRFALQNLGVLKSAGEEINMAAKVFPDLTDTTSFDGTIEPATVVTSVRSSDITLDAFGGPVEIDVAQANTMFASGGNAAAFISSTKVKYGYLKIVNNGSTPLNSDGTPWSFSTGTNNTATGLLTITNGVFSASLNDPGKVFLDINRNGEYDDGTDLLATVSADGQTASWSLTNADLNTIYSQSLGVNMVLEADGTSAINQLSEAAKATFKIDYGSGNSDSYNRDLIYIKRNGVACTIYNVPTLATIDRANIRITNTSGSDATVYVTLRDAGGTRVLDNFQLPGDPLKPNETRYINSDMLENDFIKTVNPNVLPLRNQRMVLDINSNVKSLEIFGLVRNASGGPLTNMSVAASGNGCD
jgi:hypothetical protein